MKPHHLGNCPHTLCFDCINNLTNKACPFCKTIFTKAHVNIALLEFISLSKYDIFKNELDKLINEVKELRHEVTMKTDSKRNDHLTKIQELKTQIETIT